MKKIYIVILLFLGSLTACNDWLEVTPEYEMEEKDAFTTADGYNTALRGLYQKAATSSLYGKELSWGILTGMSHDIDYYYTNDAYYAGQFDYERASVKSIISGIWQGLYNVIANANLLINNIKDCDPGMFLLDTLERDRIYGEALGMRAIMHLDVVRLFTPAPSCTGGMEQLVPYHDKFPSEFTVPKTTMETLDLIIADLKKSAELLAPYDTVYKTMRTNQPRDNEWFRARARGWHFNYPAAVCYLARAYMHKGDYENALFYANHFYTRLSKGRKTSTGAADANAFFMFDPGYVGGQSSYKGYKALCECPFALYQPDLLQMLANYEKSYFGLGLFFGVKGAEYDFLDLRFGDDIDDMRKSQFEIREKEDTYSDMWENYYTMRYDEKQHATYHFERDALPMIRMSEMYYILIECHYRNGNETEAIRLLNEWRKGKQMSRPIDAVASLTDLQDILINDARRDWVTEGQVFHLCKRMNRPLIDNWTGDIIPLNATNSTFPIPESQDL